MPTRFRIVLDTNVLLRGMVNVRSPSGWVLDACERRQVIPLLSKPVLAEYLAILTDPKIVARYPELTDQKVKATLEHLAYVADIFGGGTVHFVFPRDPRDAKFIELTIAGRATHLITKDADLLDLPAGHDDAARRLRRRSPALRILPPETFIEDYGFIAGAE